MRPPPPLPRRGSGPNDAGLGRPVSNPLSGPRTGPTTPGRPTGTGGPMPLPSKPRVMKKGGAVAKKAAKSVPKGMHKMPDGKLMKNSDMAGRAMKKTGADAKGRAMATKMKMGGYARKGK